MFINLPSYRMMMEEKTILKLSLAIAMTGIILLLFISETVEIKSYKIEDLTKKDAGKDVEVAGIITRVTETPGLFIFNIQDETGEITAILFKDGKTNITANIHVEIQGEAQEYKGDIEIIVDQITSVD